MEDKAQVSNFPQIRAWGDSSSVFMERSAESSLRQTLKAHHGSLSTVNALALSGGGADGAFGAGLICGWTKAGNRPVFQLVSGISTGALMAPLAFLGPKYDPQLKKLYTTLSDDKLYHLNNPLGILLNYAWPILRPSIVDNKPLRTVIKETATQEMLDEIAQEHLKGRRLLIGTTQLNAQRLVIWDIGAIATSHTPGALALFRKILLASASLPGIFPPQYFNLTYQGKTYKELHVDGGVATQVILFEKSISPFARVYSNHSKGIEKKLFIIRNLKVNPEWENVKPRLHYILGRVISTLTKNQGIGDLYRLYAYSVRDNIDYNLAYVPRNFKLKANSMFDGDYTLYMTKNLSCPRRRATIYGLAR